MKKTYLILMIFIITLMLASCGPLPISVKFDANGGVASSTNLELKEGSEVGLPTATKDNKTFLGWFDQDGNEVTSTTTITNNITLYAKWDSYDVTYLSNDELYQVVSVAHDEKIIFPKTNPKDSFDANHQYTFEGWDIDKDTIVTKDLTVNAIWNSEDIMWAKVKAGVDPIKRTMFRLSYIYKDSLFDVEPNTFSKELALFAFGAANLTEDGTTISSFYSSLEFDNIHLSESYSHTPTTSSIGYCFAHKQVKGSEVICVTIRGENYQSEWVNNFIVGQGGDHQGFSESATQVKDDLEEYLNSYSSGNIKLLITGYSRGGGVANNLAHQILSSDNYLQANAKMYTYTFEAPASVEMANGIDYPNVFNLVNSADIVCYVPPIRYGFKRCGIDIELYSTNLESALLANGYMTKLPSFEAKAGSYTHDIAFTNYVIDTLTTFNGDTSSSLNTRQLYYSNYQESICYLMGLMLKMDKSVITTIQNDLSSRSKVELAALLTANGLYSYLSNMLNSNGVSYDVPKLSSACQALSKLINGPAMPLITNLAGSNNLSRMLAMHAFEVTYSLLVNLEVK
ncbi:MAG: InlB B-repeat-containing protein [Bacilli bacterium]|nr:InlB B-repeat-containing protein [Bacilli bacterium]